METQLQPEVFNYLSDIESENTRVTLHFLIETKWKQEPSLKFESLFELSTHQPHEKLPLDNSYREDVVAKKLPSDQ